MVCFHFFTASLGSVVMIHFGYRATVCIGAGIVMVAVIALSFLKEDDEHAVKFFLYGPAREFNSNETKLITQSKLNVKTTIIVKTFSFSFVNKHLRDVLKLSKLKN
jgi:hypothetical protein